ncbi:MAG: hypothetical protein DCC75_04290 [Proteobacteria bacterium]|nr:MAG: hypothetical protein DCC75_04290 [Pseudomonadota bacterium]
MSDFDVAIVGGSLAGSLCADLLGRYGFKVVLFEPEEFPRRKACGEGLSILAKHLLELAGIWSDKLEGESQPFYGYLFQIENGRTIPLNCCDDAGSPQGFGISRIVLDNQVYKEATSLRSVELVKERVKRFYNENGRVEILTEGAKFNADSLVLACGGAISALVNSELADPVEVDRPHHSRRFGAAFWFRGAWKDEISRHIILQNTSNSQLILTPLGPDRVNLSCLVSSRTNESTARLDRGDLAELGSRLARRHGFEISEVLDYRGASDISSYRLKGVPQNIFVIGDSIERFDPVGGMGMAHAAVSALAAVAALRGHFEGGLDLNQQWREYMELRESAAKYLRWQTKLGYCLTVRQNLYVKVLAEFLPGFGASILKLLRLGFQGKTARLKRTLFGELEEAFAY